MENENSRRDFIKKSAALVIGTITASSILNQAFGSNTFEENNFTPHLFLEKISELLANQKILASMSEAAADFARPKAAQIIAEYITHYLTS